MAADTLIIEQGAVVINTSSAVSGHAVALNPAGAWTVSVNGTLYTETDTGLRLQGSNPALSTITELYDPAHVLVLSAVANIDFNF